MKFELVNLNYSSRPTTLADSEMVADLINICSQKLIGEDEISAKELWNDWQSPGFSVESDSILIFNEGNELVGYGDLWGATEPYTRMFSMVRVHPDFCGLGLGRSLNEWAVNRAKQIAARASEGAQVVMASFVNRRDQQAVNLLNQLGMSSARYSWIMEIKLDYEIEIPALPEGFILRVVEQSEYEAIYQLDRDAFKDHWGYTETPFEEGYKLFLNQMVDEPFYDPKFWFVIEQDGKMVGMVINTPACSSGENYGWIQLLGVRREWRKQGLGKALLLHSFSALKNAGCTYAGLSVDSQSLTGATRLYEGVGMETKEVYMRFEKVIREGVDLRTKFISS